MLKYAILLATFTTFVECSNEMNFGIQTIQYIMNYYLDNLVALEAQFGEHIHKYLADLETRALAVNDQLATCVHEGTAPVEEELVHKVKEALEKESNKILETVKSIDNLSADEVNELWTSVSLDGTYRNQMNEQIMALKGVILQGLQGFKMAITQKCLPIITAAAGRVAG